MKLQLSEEFWESVTNEVLGLRFSPSIFINSPETYSGHISGAPITIPYDMISSINFDTMFPSHEYYGPEGIDQVYTKAYTVTIKGGKKISAITGDKENATEHWIEKHTVVIDSGAKKRFSAFLKAAANDTIANNSQKMRKLYKALAANEARAVKN
jgi:hypothetical protein